jgi:MBG domain (YGX type)/Bacterial Ig domain/Bacterial Ig-like domain (group 3)
MGFAATGQSVSNYAVQVSAAVQTNPPQITLSWPSDPAATNYTLYRKPRDAASWGAGTALPANAANFVDSNVVAGAAYEYRITKEAPGYQGEGCIYAGLTLPLVETRGKVILVVDNSMAAGLATELAHLQQDLVGDGWTVLRHDVERAAVDPANTSSSVWAARSNELAQVKALITADYNADPVNVRAVFLLGHVPVPYAGSLEPDGHSDHLGAWPADVFYGDMTGAWTDSTVNNTTASDPRNRNVPGDGKFDQSILPADVALQVGRVDFANLPAFPQAETELLRQYLNKDHNFRHKLVKAAPGGLIDDNFGTSYGEAFAVNGWRNFAPFFGPTNIDTGGWLTIPPGQTYLWGYGCGPGTYTSASGVASTSDFVTSDTPIVFTMLFGSYFGDWDSQNNLMRAQLATPTCNLTCVWAGRPYWYFHHMGLGETIGFSTRLSQNNSTTYSGNRSMRGVHIALMGDPTLRMHPVAPPSALALATNSSGGVDLSWAASPDPLLGYHVYRAPSAGGPFVRLTSELISGTSYTDPAPISGTYMVRAVRLEVTPSGSYYNASQGAFQDFVGPPGPPVLIITAQSAAKGYGAPVPPLVALYSGFVNGDTTNSLTSQPVLSTPADAASPVGDYPIHISGAVDTNYTIIHIDGTLRVLPAATKGVLATSPNPSLPGQPVTFTYTLSTVAPAIGTPTGAVQFSLRYEDVGPLVPLSNGVATLTLPLDAGWYDVSAVYLADWNFYGSSSSLPDGQTVNSPPVAVPYSITRDPSSGVTVAIAALLANDFDPDGDPIYFVGVSPTSEHGGTVAIDASRTWVLYTPAPGFTQTDSFTYTIEDGYSAMATGLVTVTVVPPPVLTITAQSTNKVYGAPLPAFTALYSGFTKGDTSANLTSPPLLSTTATSNSPAGSYPITASGASSSNYAILYVPGTLTILPAATTGSLTSSTNPALPGQSVTFAVMLSAVAPGAGTPTGTVQFKIDGTNVPSPVPLSDGAACYTTTNLAHGLHAVVAEYAGDGSFTGTTNVLAPNQLINTLPVTGPVTLQRDPTTGVKVSVATLLSKATDADGDPLAFTGQSATSANGGIVASNAGWIFYTPAPGFTNTDTFTYAVSDSWAAPVSGLVTVIVRTSTGPSPNLTIIDLGSGVFSILGDGIPDRTYRIQSADAAESTNWQTLGTAPADPYGIFQFNDTNGSPQRFYRSVYP